MAFSEEEEAQIKDMMGKMGDFLSKQQEQKEPEKKDETKLLDEAKKNLENKNDEAENQNSIERAVSFNMQISTFAEKYKDILPASVNSVIETANGKTYSNAVAKADEMRKAIIEAYLEVQANIDTLPEGMKAKANAFKALTEDAKKAKSGQYWEIVEVGAELQTATRKAEAIRKANGNINNGEEDAFRKRFLAIGDKWKRKE